MILSPTTAETTALEQLTPMLNLTLTGGMDTPGMVGFVLGGTPGLQQPLENFH